MQFHQQTIKKNLFHTTLAAGIALLLASPLQAAPKSCKDLPMTQCGNSDDCSWIRSYSTKSGTKVKAYCRTKPKKGASTKATGSNKKVTKKSKENSEKG